MKILFSNLGYATGIDGSLLHHVRYAMRRIYNPVKVQRRVLDQFRRLIDEQEPDICCIVEIDQGSFHSAGLNQMDAIVASRPVTYDIHSKYAPQSRFGSLPFHIGKSNGFIAQQPLMYRRRFFRCGLKRLVYDITLPTIGRLLFAHFSLQHRVRQQQLEELQEWIEEADEPHVILADFNILHGPQELAPLLEASSLQLLNDPQEPTFTFSSKRHVLDLGLCSHSLVPDTSLQVIPQPYSDHAALLVHIERSPGQ